MKDGKLYETAQLLKAGQIVQIEDDFFRAIKFIGEPVDSPCLYCDLDSICRGDINDVCNELDSHGQGKWILALAHPL